MSAAAGLVNSCVDLLAAAAAAPESAAEVARGKEVLALINACLNGVSTVLLVCAFVFIKRKDYRRHAIAVLAALASSAVFLVFYLTSYFLYDERSSGLSPGPLRTTYYAILFPHMVLAVVMLPMIGVALYRAYRRQWARHHRIASPTYWIWLYVSITGVVIYFMLYHVFPARQG